ncbi:HpcH/HpaI aldolase/citrate lyase family protein [Sphingomonas rubra]|uniref:Citrate lyase subunit beta / citryl-CoA lyase n=1 Tax=Sphingomonas rubra TaxID=634430 RepID=A0A1I5SBV7_9SPHN|nr:CoA ester lyase [Sphingomonas rubra]SFP68182.1 citrate lyase subunit beta / citryl-CoA lyase [Sphingomonas rubra]
MPTYRRRRSALFMPASNPRAISKARTLPCDVVILDLEDAVAPEMKDDARGAALAAVAEGGFGPRELVIRVNAIDTPAGAADLAALRQVEVAPDAVLLPKLAGARMVADARAALGDDIPLWAMIETAAALLALPAIAATGDFGLAALVAGTNDLALDLRCRPGSDRGPLLPALAQIVAAARAGGMVALDGVLNAIDDPERLRAECDQGRGWGFDGKTLIHPAQIDAANAAFGPTPAEHDWATRVIALFADPANARRGAAKLDGAMVERLHLAEAERIVALADPA